MNTPPRRRWFQFKLSTWFVLIAIIAWAIIATRTDVPAALFKFHSDPATLPQNYFDGTCIYPVVPGGETGSMVVFPDGERFPFVSIPTYQFIRFLYRPTPEKSSHSISDAHPNPSLVWPALALVVFLTWKSAWLFVERHRAKRAAP